MFMVAVTRPVHGWCRVRSGRGGGCQSFGHFHNCFYRRLNLIPIHVFMGNTDDRKIRTVFHNAQNTLSS